MSKFTIDSETAIKAVEAVEKAVQELRALFAEKGSFSDNPEGKPLKYKGEDVGRFLEEGDKLTFSGRDGARINMDSRPLGFAKDTIAKFGVVTSTTDGRIVLELNDPKYRSEDLSVTAWALFADAHPR